MPPSYFPSSVTGSQLEHTLTDLSAHISLLLTPHSAVFQYPAVHTLPEGGKADVDTATPPRAYSMLNVIRRLGYI